MQLNLVDRRADLVVHTQIHQAGFVKIADADGPQNSFPVHLLQGPPCPVIIAEGLVNQIQIQIIHTQPLHGCLRRLPRFRIAGILHPQLCGDKQFFTGNAAFLQSGTYRLLAKVFVPWGIGLDVVDITDPAQVSAALAAKHYTYLWVETPSNPLLNITDIAATSALAHQYGTKVVVDNTFASPILQHPLADGADAAESIVFDGLTKAQATFNAR